MARRRGSSTALQRRTPKRTGAPRPFPLSRRSGGTLLLLVAALSAVGLFTADGGVPSWWNGLLRAAFGGWGSFLTPLLLGAFGLALIWSTTQAGYRFRRREAAGWLLLFGSFLTVFQLVATPQQVALPTAGGGYLGLLVVEVMGRGGAAGSAAIGGIAGAALAANVGPRELGSWLLAIVAATFWGGKQAARLLRRALSAIRRVRGSSPVGSSSTYQPHFRINRPGREEETHVVAGVVVPAKAPRGARPTGQKAERASGEAAPAALPPTPLGGDGVAREWRLPPITLLEQLGEGEPSESDIRQKVQVIEETLSDFGIKARVTEVNPGPAVTQFGLDPGYRERRGRNGDLVRRDKVKVSEITALRDDLALALAARTVRIEAPVPGRAVVGLEIPNSTVTVVGLRKLIESTAFQRVRAKSKLAVALGQDVAGAAVAADLAKMPHLLIAGATGSGKSVCINAIVTCFLLNATPAELRLVMIDPKRVELTAFRDVPHLLRSVVVDVDQAVTVLKWVMHEMETRLKRFEAHGVRNIDGYHRLMGTRDGKDGMPYIAVLIDELADLMMTAPEEVERSICRLAQLARATGIHLVIATQRPSVDVVTGLIKANFPTRISFAVASQVDSRTILDSAGAEQLLGSGDMLYLPADASKPRRLQGVFVSEEEVKSVVDFWKNAGPSCYIQELEEAPGWSKGHEEDNDPLYERAVDVARQHTRVSASLMQRRLGVGYNRAARLVDLLEERGVVGAAEGGKPREVFMPADDGNYSQTEPQTDWARRERRPDILPD